MYISTILSLIKKYNSVSWYSLSLLGDARLGRRSKWPKKVGRREKLAGKVGRRE